MNAELWTMPAQMMNRGYGFGHAPRPANNVPYLVGFIYVAASRNQTVFACPRASVIRPRVHTIHPPGKFTACPNLTKHIFLKVHVFSSPSRGAKRHKMRRKGSHTHTQSSHTEHRTVFKILHFRYIYMSSFCMRRPGRRGVWYFIKWAYHL